MLVMRIIARQPWVAALESFARLFNTSDRASVLIRQLGGMKVC